MEEQKKLEDSKILGQNIKTTKYILGIIDSQVGVIMSVCNQIYYMQIVSPELANIANIANSLLYRTISDLAECSHLMQDLLKKDCSKQNLILGMRKFVLGVNEPSEGIKTGEEIPLQD
jgi:hypothetical protein